MPDSPTEKALRARLAAHTLWSGVDDRSAHTAPARAAADVRFEKEVDPDGRLDPRERAIRAAHARKAFFTRLALKSVSARRKAAEHTAAAEAAERELGGGR